MVKLLGFIGFMLVMIKAILYERTAAVCASMDFGKGVGRSEFCGDSWWSRWRKETIKTGIRSLCAACTDKYMSKNKI